MTTPAEEFAALIRGRQPEPITETDLARDDNGDVLVRRHRPPKPDPSQASGAHGKAPVDPAGMFGEAITNALTNPGAGRP